MCIRDSHCDDRPDDSGASAAGPRMPFVPAVATANEGAHCEAPTSQEDSMGATFGATTEEKPRTRVAADLPLATVSGRAEARLVPIHAQTAGDRMLLRPATAGAPPPPDASEVAASASARRPPSPPSFLRYSTARNTARTGRRRGVSEATKGSPPGRLGTACAVVERRSSTLRVVHLAVGRPDP